MVPIRASCSGFDEYGEFKCNQLRVTEILGKKRKIGLGVETASWFLPGTLLRATHAAPVAILSPAKNEGSFRPGTRFRATS